MNTKQRILSIRLAEKISSQPDFAKAIGISVIQKVNDKGGVIHELFENEDAAYRRSGYLAGCLESGGEIQKS